jgi:hypothetical protein
MDIILLKYKPYTFYNLRERSLGRPRCRFEDIFKIDIQEKVCGVWTGSSWLRLGTGGGKL